MSPLCPWRLCGVALVLGVFSQGHAGELPTLSRAQSTYLLSCGGCHGIQGISARELVPDLLNRVGYFMCTDEGRQYIVHLPNIAFAAVSNDELADLLNFVIFGLGGPSAPVGARPYTAHEVGELRTSNVLITDLRSRRQAVLASLVKACKGNGSVKRPAPG